MAETDVEKHEASIRVRDLDSEPYIYRRSVQRAGKAQFRQASIMKCTCTCVSASLRRACTLKEGRIMIMGVSPAAVYANTARKHARAPDTATSGGWVRRSSSLDRGGSMQNSR